MYRGLKDQPEKGMAGLNPLRLNLRKLCFGLTDMPDDSGYGDADAN